MKEEDKMKKKTIQDLAYSVLDLSPINEGSTAASSFQHTVDLANMLKNGVIIDTG